MATASEIGDPVWTASTVIAHFGNIPIARICTSPAPGQATEANVIELHDQHDRLFELIDGTLVEKAMGGKNLSWHSSLPACCKASFPPIVLEKSSGLTV